MLFLTMPNKPYPSMHPEIVKFWESKGWSIEHRTIYQSYVRIKIANNHYNEYTVASYRYDPINYFFNGSFVSEQKMLRLIKLQAFI